MTAREPVPKTTRDLVPMSRKKQLPRICLDEHVPPYVKEHFVAEKFRVIRANESGYKGRNELDYLGEMYANNEVFVTADGKFVDILAESGFKRHAGVVWLPEQNGPGTA